MTTRQKIMKFELPFKLSSVEVVEDNVKSYKVFFYKNKLFAELFSENGVAQVIPLNDSAAQLPKCRETGWWLRGPSAIYFVKSSRFSGSLKFCWRNNCELCEASDNVKVVGVFDYFDSVALIYRRGREYYAIIDDISGFTSTRIASNKPQQILFRNGVLLLIFKDYVRVLSPVTGLIDVALTEEIEPIGIDLSRGHSSVLLYSKSSKILFSLSRTNGVEPLASCDDVISVRDISGASLVLCDFDSINGAFYPFYAGKIFVDTFSYTDNFNIINPYILSFVESDNKRYFIVAIIASSPMYINVLRREGISIKKIMASAGIRGIERIILGSIEKLFGPIDINDSISDVNVVVYRTSQSPICLGAHCGKCIIHVNKLDIISDERKILLRIGPQSYKPSYVFDSEAVFVINDTNLCEDNAFENLGLCYGDKCVPITSTSERLIDAQLLCEPLRFSDVDMIIATCRIKGKVLRIVNYSPCILVQEDGNSIRLYISKDRDCVIGLVTPQGYVVKQHISYNQLIEPLVREIPRLVSIRPVRKHGYSLLISFDYEKNGIIPISINDVFIPVKAGNVVLRLSGDTRIRISDGMRVHSIDIGLPRRGSIVTRLNGRFLRMECSNGYCTAFCGSNILSGNIIDIDLLWAETPYCDVVLMSRGTTQMHKINLVIEAIRLSAIAGLRLLQAL